MSYQSPYSCFYFESYQYDAQQSKATFRYSFDKTRYFEEELVFESPSSAYDSSLLKRTLELAHILLGISYYKAFPSSRVQVESFKLSSNQAKFFTAVYRDGLSQFVYENQLQPSDIAEFVGEGGVDQGLDYQGRGLVALQSGGKDSLLLAELIKQAGESFTSLYVKTGSSHPAVIDGIGASRHRDVERRIDGQALRLAASDGGLNGHVPITYLVIAMALIDMVLHGQSTLLLGIGQEGEEPYLTQGDYAIRHQWSKTYAAELMMANYVHDCISPDMKVGSPIRGLTELRVAELFAELGWEKYGRSFSSCNLANYRQGQTNDSLSWCGSCAKCANSFLLFAPFVEPLELSQVFGGNLFANASLAATFKGLLGIDDATKPFECVGETGELRLAYHMARQRYPEAGYDLPFAVPPSSFDYRSRRPMQSWAESLLAI